MKWALEEDTGYTRVKVRAVASTGNSKEQPSWGKEVDDEVPPHLLDISASRMKIFELLPSGKK